MDGLVSCLWPDLTKLNGLSALSFFNATIVPVYLIGVHQQHGLYKFQNSYSTPHWKRVNQYYLLLKTPFQGT